MNRKILGIGVGVLLAVTAYGCGSSDSSVSTGGRDAKVQAAQEASGSQTVEYQGVAFDVPADWPVYDLAQDPSTCVRFDTHAVYLGTPGRDMQCPAGIVGHTETVLVEPTASPTAQQKRDAAPGLTAQDLNGLSVQVADETEVQGQLVVVTPTVTATISTGADRGVARQILASFRAAGQ